MTTRVTTIGFTESSAQDFFDRIKKAGVKKVVDVRLHNTSQIAGFAKARDLAYFLRTIADVDYSHEPLLTPTESMLTAYRKQKGDWSVYEAQFVKLMKQRKIEQKLTPAMLKDACLLCSEATPHHCHRRLVCEYLNKKWGGALSVEHL